MTREIKIVERGRGPQLSTSRVTVQDLVPYFQDGCSQEEIQRWIPTLSAEEIQVVARYIHDHKEKVMEQDRRIRERNANRVVTPEARSILTDGRAKLQALKEKLLVAKSNGEAT